MALVFKMRQYIIYNTPALPACFGSLLSSLLFLLASCIPEPLEVKNVPTIEPQIVVASQMIADQGVVVLLTKTFGALDVSDDSDPVTLLSQIAINDADVTISGPSGSYTLQHLENGVYGSIEIPLEAGESYMLMVKSPSMGEVYATTTVQRRVEFEEVDADLHYNGFGDTLAQISYVIQDPEEPNWYLVNVQEIEYEGVSKNLINPRAYTVLLEDKAFNGTLHQGHFRVFPRDYAPGDTIAVTLSNVSEDYFKYQELRRENRYSFVEFIGEPINYPTNVVGGRGFFTLYVPDVRFFIFDEDTE
jgi:hypothetical protein